jgi:hypothetical protein
MNGRFENMNQLQPVVARTAYTIAGTLKIHTMGCRVYKDQRVLLEVPPRNILTSEEIHENCTLEIQPLRPTWIELRPQRDQFVATVYRCIQAGHIVEAKAFGGSSKITIQTETVDVPFESTYAGGTTFYQGQYVLPIGSVPTPILLLDIQNNAPGIHLRMRVSNQGEPWAAIITQNYLDATPATVWSQMMRVTPTPNEWIDLEVMFPSFRENLPSSGKDVNLPDVTDYRTQINFRTALGGNSITPATIEYVIYNTQAMRVIGRSSIR